MPETKTDAPALWDDFLKEANQIVRQRGSLRACSMGKPDLVAEKPLVTAPDADLPELAMVGMEIWRIVEKDLRRATASNNPPKGGFKTPHLGDVDEPFQHLMALEEWTRGSLSKLLRKQGTWAQMPDAFLIDWAQKTVGERNLFQPVLKEIENRYPEQVPQEACEPLTECRLQIKKWAEGHPDKTDRDFMARIERLTTQGVSIPLIREDAFSDKVIADLKALPVNEQQPWCELLLMGGKISGQVSKKWRKDASALVQTIGHNVFFEHVSRWFDQVGKPFSKQPLEDVAEHARPYLSRVAETSVPPMQALVWACVGVDDAAMVPLLSRLADRCFARIRGIGPRCPKVGNACAQALTHFSDPNALGQVIRLQQKIKKAWWRKPIETALRKAAEARGMAPEDLEDLGVPDYELDADGQLTHPFGEHKAQLIITGPTTAELRWFKPDGKPQKSVPKAVKDTDPDAVKKLKAIHKELQQQLGAQRDRFEKLYRKPRHWPFADWRKRFIGHAVLRQIASRLIWRIEHGGQSVDAGWLDGQFMDANDKAVKVNDNAIVKLWHPIDSETQTITAWRDWLDRHEITQPFKQAYREVYLLTDAERQTGTYSNRFAAHVLRFLQLRALCEARDWRMGYAGAWDSSDFEPPQVKLPAYEIWATYWVEPVSVGADGVADLASTDQVRFMPMGEDQPLPLDQVPQLVFSEVMRDVDLFVGVCSIGNDPNWHEGGAGHQHDAYWQSFSFGDLTDFAKARKDVLERVIPRLKIASKCTIADRYLTVEGKLGSYKIHLGSGNILMSPNDRYLCIVADRTKAQKQDLYLPFEGDAKLAEILAKAFMLAEDHKIKDPTIVSQLNRRD